VVKRPAMQAVVSVLESEGVDTIFGVPGAAILPLYNALRGSSIRHLLVRHEEGGTHAADGWARVTGNVGVCLGTSGPAGTNMITGLYTALADSIPIIAVTGQAPRAKLHQEAFQAVDICEIARPVTKWSVQLKEAAQAPWIFREAFRIARSGRPGPVLIDLPVDLSQKEITYDPELDAPFPVHRPQPPERALRALLQMIESAERPLLLAGGGVIGADAAEELVALAEYLQVPVTITLMGKGAIPEDHPLYAGMGGIQTQTRWGNALLLESDLIVAVGARFGDRYTGDLETFRGERRFAHIDIEPMQLGRVFEPDLGIVGHAKPTLAALLELATDTGLDRERRRSWVARVAELRTSLTRSLDQKDIPIKPPRVFGELNAFFERDTTFVTAIGLYQIWSGQLQETFLPRRYLVCGQAGPLGWEIPAAIGAKTARPDRQVVVVVGDYSFQFLMEELAVAAQYKVPFVIVMVNNEYLGLIRQAEIPYDMNVEVDLHFGEHGIDHVKVAEAMGCPGRRVTDPEQIRAALEWASAESERLQVPALVEIMVEREANAAMGLSIADIKEFEPFPDAGPVQTDPVQTDDQQPTGAG